MKANDLFWNLFCKTGSPEAYLGYLDGRNLAGIIPEGEAAALETDLPGEVPWLSSKSMPSSFAPEAMEKPTACLP